MFGTDSRRARGRGRVGLRVGVAAALLLALCAGCASTPEASRERDEEAKRFEPVSRDSVLYVYRPDRFESSGTTTLWANGQLIGDALPGTYFRILVLPGRTVLHASLPDPGRIEVTTQGYDVTYVEMQTVTEESPHSYFRIRTAEEAQAAIQRCCSRLEVWRSGQPRLLW